MPATASSLRRYPPTKPLVKWASPRVLSESPSGQPFAPQPPPTPPRPPSVAFGAPGVSGALLINDPFSLPSREACAALASLAVTLDFPVNAVPALLRTIVPSPQSLLAEFLRFSKQQLPRDPVVLKFIHNLAAAATAPPLPSGFFLGSSPAPVAPPPAATPTVAPRAPPEPSGFLGLFPLPLREAALYFLAAARAFGYALPTACNDLRYACKGSPLDADCLCNLAYDAADLICSDVSPSIALEIALDQITRPPRNTEGSRRSLAVEGLAGLAGAPSPPPSGATAEVGASQPWDVPPSPALPAATPPSAPPAPAPAAPPAPVTSAAPPAPPPPAPPPPAPPTAAPAVPDAQRLRERVARLPLPPWYGPPHGRPSGSAKSLLPRAWSELCDDCLNAAPLSSSTGAACPVNVDRLISRLNSESFLDNRGLFVTDLGRAFVWHALQGLTDPSNEVLSLALEAVRKSLNPRFRKDTGATFSKAERDGGVRGLSDFVELVDRTLLDAYADTRRMWDSPQSAWSDASLSAVDVLAKLRDLGNQCDKSDTDVINKWISTLDDACAAFNYFPLMLLKNAFHDSNRFSKASELLAALQSDGFGRMRLSDMAAGAPQQPQAPSSQPFHQRRPRQYAPDTAVAALTAPTPDQPQVVDVIAAAIRQLQMQQHPAVASVAGAEAVPAAPRSDFPRRKDPIVLGFADFQRWKGLIEVLPADRDVPMYNPSAQDGKFTTDCPFCGVGAPLCKTPPVKSYRNASEYEREHNCKPFQPGSSRRLGHNERLAHFSPRCAELWFAMRRHVESMSPAEQARLLKPLEDAAFFALLPPQLQPRPRT